MSRRWRWSEIQSRCTCVIMSNRSSVGTWWSGVLGVFRGSTKDWSWKGGRAVWSGREMRESTRFSNLFIRVLLLNQWCCLCACPSTSGRWMCNANVALQDDVSTKYGQRQTSASRFQVQVSIMHSLDDIAESKYGLNNNLSPSDQSFPISSMPAIYHQTRACGMSYGLLCPG